MTLPAFHCNSDWIEAYLLGATGAEEESSFVEHLESCEACRHELETRAADDAVWRDAVDFLPDLEFDSVRLSDVHDSDAAANDDGVVHRQTSVQIESVLGALAPTDDPHMLGRLGSYEISGVIGAGGMGVVLKGVDVALDRTVAVKVLAPHLASSGAARKRFAREAKAAAAVIHPNVIAIHGVSNDGRLPFLVMPYIRGNSLQKRIDQQGPLAVVEVLRIGQQIAAGLAAAHEQGLVHRDIKPANILLDDGVERVTITDFGLARAIDDATMTRSGVIAGTPQFMSPEQARGESLDDRSDLFSLGSVLYAMCTGRPPFRASSSFGVLHRIVHDDARNIQEINSEIPIWLGDMVKWLHAKHPDERPQSAVHVEQLLHRLLLHAEHPATNGLPEEIQVRTATRARFVARSRTVAFTIVFILTAIVLLAVPFFAAFFPARDMSGDSPSRDIRPENSSVVEQVDADDIRWNDGTDAALEELDETLRQLELYQHEPEWSQE
ncbi:MAG: protein kinase [Pirellulaceae bacterium]|nr:protein kinase [Planctomycetales bacterium]